MSLKVESCSPGAGGPKTPKVTTKVKKMRFGGHTVTTTDTTVDGTAEIVQFGTPGTVIKYGIPTKAPATHYAMPGPVPAVNSRRRLNQQLAGDRGLSYDHNTPQQRSRSAANQKTTVSPQSVGGFIERKTVTRQYFTPAPPLPPCAVGKPGVPMFPSRVPMDERVYSGDVSTKSKKEKRSIEDGETELGTDMKEAAAAAQAGFRKDREAHGRILVLRRKSSSSW